MKSHNHIQISWREFYCIRNVINLHGCLCRCYFLPFFVCFFFSLSSQHHSRLQWNSACIQRSRGKKFTEFPRELSCRQSLFRKLWLWLASTHISSSAACASVCTRPAFTPRVRWPRSQPHRKHGQTRGGQGEVKRPVFVNTFGVMTPPRQLPDNTVCSEDYETTIPNEEVAGLLSWTTAELYITTNFCRQPAVRHNFASASTYRKRNQNKAQILFRR